MRRIVWYILKEKPQNLIPCQNTIFIGRCYALLPAVLGLLFTTVGDGIVFKYWLQSFYPNLVELNQTAKEINFIKVMNELDGITFGKPESWVVLAADAWRRWSATSSNVIFLCV